MVLTGLISLHENAQRSDEQCHVHIRCVDESSNESNSEKEAGTESEEEKRGVEERGTAGAPYEGSGDGVCDDDDCVVVDGLQITRDSDTGAPMLDNTRRSCSNVGQVGRQRNMRDAEMSDHKVIVFQGSVRDEWKQDFVNDMGETKQRYL